MEQTAKEVDISTDNCNSSLEGSNALPGSPRGAFESPLDSSKSVIDDYKPPNVLNGISPKVSYFENGRKGVVIPSAQSPGDSDFVSEPTRPSTSILTSSSNLVWPTEQPLICVSTTASQDAAADSPSTAGSAQREDGAGQSPPVDGQNDDSESTISKDPRQAMSIFQPNPGMCATFSETISEEASFAVQPLCAEGGWASYGVETAEVAEIQPLVNQQHQSWREPSPPPTPLELLSSDYILRPSCDPPQFDFEGHSGHVDHTRNPIETEAGPPATSPRSYDQDYLETGIIDVEWVEVRIADSQIDYEFDKDDVEQVFSQLANVREVLIDEGDRSVALVQVEKGEGARLVKILSDHKLQDMNGRLTVRLIPNTINDDFSIREAEQCGDSEIPDEEASAALLRLLCESTNLTYCDNTGIRLPYISGSPELISPLPNTVPAAPFGRSRNNNSTPLDISFEDLFDSKDESKRMIGENSPHNLPPAYGDVLGDVWGYRHRTIDQRETHLNNLSSPRQQRAHWSTGAGTSLNHPRRSNPGPNCGAFSTTGAPNENTSDGLDVYLRATKSAQTDYDRANTSDLEPSSRFDALAMTSNACWDENTPDIHTGQYSATSFTHAVRDFPFAGASRPFDSPERPARGGGSESRSCLDDRRPSFGTPLNDTSMGNCCFESPSSNEGKMQMWLSSNSRLGDYDDRMYAPSMNHPSQSPVERHNNGGDHHGPSSKVRKWTARYDIQIPTDNSFQVTRRIIGTRGANMKRINQFTGAKLRLRGRGSGYLEGSSRMEADDPLHLCISCCEFSKYRAAKQMVDRLLRQIYAEYDAWSAEIYAVPPRLALQVREVFLPNRDSGDTSGLAGGEPKPNGMANSSCGGSRPPPRPDYPDDI